MGFLYGSQLVPIRVLTHSLLLASGKLLTQQTSWLLGTSHGHLMVLLTIWLLHFCCFFYLEHPSLFPRHSQTWISFALVLNIRLLLTMFWS